MTEPRAAKRARLRVYADAITMWCAGYDTKDIADAIGVPEAMAALWIANYRDLMAQAKATP